MNLIFVLNYKVRYCPTVFVVFLLSHYSASNLLQPKKLNNKMRL